MIPSSRFTSSSSGGPALDARAVARTLGGRVVGPYQVSAPGPGHSAADLSLSIRIDPRNRDGFVVTPHAGEDWRDCRDFIKAKLGVTFQPGRPAPTTRPTPSRHRDDTTDRIARAVSIFNEAVSIKGTPAEIHLRSRGLDVDADELHHVIRFNPRTPWGSGADAEMVPCMVGLYRHVTSNRPMAIHRTRLTLEGIKVGRMGLGPSGGCALKIDRNSDVTTGLTIAEGIETALSGQLLGFRPVWALGSAGQIKNLAVLDGIDALTVLAEHDDANRLAVKECAARWLHAKRQVIQIKSTIGKDLNDALQAGVA